MSSLKAMIQSKMTATAGTMAIIRAKYFDIPLARQDPPEWHDEDRGGQDIPEGELDQDFAPSPFSSPGRMYSAPSQGLMKSNWRYS